MAFAYSRIRDAELHAHLWRFATKRARLRAVSIDSMVWTPPTWSAGTFSVGSIAAYTPTSGVYDDIPGVWQARAAKTGSNTTTPDLDTDWSSYAGPDVVELYDSDTSYYAGDIVLVPAAWSGVTTYAANDVVRSSTTWYVSLQGSNTNNAVSDTDWWEEWTGPGRDSGTYGLTAGDVPIPLTYPSGHAVYLSLRNGNDDNPVSATGTWLSLGGTVASVSILYPLGAGLSSTTTSNVFRLPVGFLRQAPSEPKAAAHPYLGAGRGTWREDWVFEGRYLLTNSPGPITLRYVSDFRDVPQMDPAFCEMLAARLALEIGPRLPGAAEDYNRLRRTYRDTRQTAMGLNAIETGPIDLELSDYIAARY